MIERERKFLVAPHLLPELPAGRVIEAGYFTKEGIAIRCTIRSDGVQKVCFKGPGLGEREEYEYSIKDKDIRGLMNLAPTYLKKTRYDFEGWEIDHFPELNLWMAEYEEAEGKPPIPNPLPRWITREVTEDSMYTNMALAWRYGRKNGR